MTTRVLVVVVIALVLSACGTNPTRESRTAPQGKTRAGDSGGLVDVGGRHLFLDCVGAGTPTVLFEAGLGLSSESWADALPEPSRITRVCTYDRAGLGQSDPALQVPDAGDDVADLERLLARGHVPPPYVLVGHSYGGLLVRLFAVRHPEQVAGVVFVDAMGRDATRRQLAIWRPSEAPELRREWGAPVQSRVNLERGEALASGIRTLGDVPVVAITGARTWKNARFPPRLQRALQRLWITMHTELAALSSDHIHVVALRSNHMVMSGNQQPWVVERAVSAVVQAYRDRAALPTCTRVFTEPGVRCLQ